MAVPELNYRDPSNGNWVVYHDSDKLNIAGGNVTGYVKFQSPATMGLNSATPANQNIEWLVGDKLRWTIGRTVAAESGGNAGSNLSMAAWADDGSFLFSAVGIERATGLVTVKADPTSALGVATKQYVDTAAGSKRIITVVSGATTAAAVAKTDYVYVCSAALTLTMPTAVGNTNQYTVKRSGTGTVTVATTSSQTIDGSTTFVIDKQWMSIDLVSDNANWVVV